MQVFGVEDMATLLCCARAVPQKGDQTSASDTSAAHHTLIMTHTHSKSLRGPLGDKEGSVYNDKTSAVHNKEYCNLQAQVRSQKEEENWSNKEQI